MIVIQSAKVGMQVHACRLITRLRQGQQFCKSKRMFFYLLKYKNNIKDAASFNLFWTIKIRNKEDKRLL